MALELLAKGIKTKDAVRQAADCTGIAKTYFTTRCSAPAQTEEVRFHGRQTRRISPPTTSRTTIFWTVRICPPQRSHQRGSKRYWALLAVAVVGIGLFSFYSPVRMVAALHCSEKNQLFLCACARCRPVPPSGPPSLQRHQTHCKARANHIHCSRTPYFEPGAIVVYPTRDTNMPMPARTAPMYSLWTKTNSATVQDGADLYQILAETVPEASKTKHRTRSILDQVRCFSGDFQIFNPFQTTGTNIFFLYM